MTTGVHFSLFISVTKSDRLNIRIAVVGTVETAR